MVMDPNAVPDQLNPEQALEAAIMMKIGQILQEDLDITVMANVVNTLASALKTVRERQQADLSPEQKMSLELAKLKHQFQIEEARLQIEAMKVQHEMQVREAQAAVKTRAEQQKGRLQVMQTQHKMAQDAANNAVKRETMRQQAAQHQTAPGTAKPNAKPNPKPAQ